MILTLAVQETFEVRGGAQPESEALKQAEESLTQAEAAVGAIDEALASPEAEGDTGGETGASRLINLKPDRPNPLQTPKRNRRHSGSNRAVPFKKLQSKDAPQVFQAGEPDHGRAPPLSHGRERI